MNTPNPNDPIAAEVQTILDAGFDPIFVSVVVTIADTRMNPRNPYRARRVQTYTATPESLAALPGDLAGLLRGASVDAQRELNKFLAVLAEPEPPAVAPPSTPSPAPAADYLTPTPPLLGAELPVAA